MPRLEIDPDIRRAETLPSAVYHDPYWFEQQRERIFARTWHMFPGHLPEPEPGRVQPWNLLAGCLDEPLLLTRDEQQIHLVSNVCTHRGALLVSRAGSAKALRCGYHGRRFSLDGRFQSMPEFEQARDFPRPCDHLATVPWARWQRFLFASLDPDHSLDELTAPLRERLTYLPFDRLEYLPDHSRDYHVAANWALYCDNYLEGFHVPYVHPSLNRVLDYDAYETEVLPRGVVQIGYASEGGACFSPPAGHPDHGRSVAGYYYWLFPSTMINVYPWGLSINLVLPLGPERSRIVYLTYTWDRSRHDTGAGAGLDQVEHEDEVVVEAVARGVRSRLYDRGRYSPTREQGVHHFHRLMARALNEE